MQSVPHSTKGRFYPSRRITQPQTAIEAFNNALPHCQCPVPSLVPPAAAQQAGRDQSLCSVG